VNLTPGNSGGALTSGELAAVLTGVAAAGAALHGFRGLLFGLHDFGLQPLELLLQQLGLPLQALDLLGIGQRLCCRRAESQDTTGKTADETAGMALPVKLSLVHKANSNGTDRIDASW
jgi:hypothetical protein